MSIHASPGVYYEIQDFSNYVSQLSSTTLALVGKSKKGPTIPTFISSVRQFTDTFGLPVSGDYSSLAAISYLEYGNSLWYRRIVGKNARKAVAEIPTATSKKNEVKVTDSSLYIYNETLDEEPLPGTVTIKIEGDNSSTVYIKDDKFTDINDNVYGKFNGIKYPAVTDYANIVDYYSGNFKFQLKDEKTDNNNVFVKYVTKLEPNYLDYSSEDIALNDASKIKVSGDTIQGKLNEWNNRGFKSSVKKSSFEMTVYSKTSDSKHIYNIFVDEKGTFKCNDIYNGLSEDVLMESSSLNLLNGDFTFTFNSEKLGTVERIVIKYVAEQFKWINLGNGKAFDNSLGTSVNKSSFYVFDLDISELSDRHSIEEKIADEFSEDLMLKDNGFGEIIAVKENSLDESETGFGYNTINYSTKKLNIALTSPISSDKKVTIEYMAKSSLKLGTLSDDKSFTTVIDAPIIKGSLAIYKDRKNVKEPIAIDDGNGNIISANEVTGTAGTIEYAKFNEETGRMYAEIDFVYGGELSDNLNSNDIEITYISSMGKIESISFGEADNGLAVEFYTEDFKDNDTVKYYGLNIWQSGLSALDMPSENFRKFTFGDTEKSTFFTNVVASTNVIFTLYDSEAIPVLNNRIVLSNGFDDEENITVNTAIKALDDFANYETYDINLVAVPDFPGDKSLALALIDLCENKRGDCFALIDPPRGLSPQNVVAWHNGDGVYASENALNSKQAALYYPWVKINNQFTESIQFVPPSVKMVSVFAYSDNNSEVWFAPAGLNRGRVFKALGVERRLTVNDRDFLYSTGTNAINPICDFVGDGIVVYGQKTLQRKPSALDRINAVRLILYVTKVLATSTKYLLFEPHDRLTWERYVLLVKPFMEDIKLRRGVYNYSVKCDETTNTEFDIDNNTMVAEVSLQPTKTTERIITRFKITGASTVAEINE